VPNVTYFNEITQSDIDDSEFVQLSNNNYISQSDLMKGLAQIGQELGKDY
jgi:hypothetical protein